MATQPLPWPPRPHGDARRDGGTADVLRTGRIQLLARLRDYAAVRRSLGVAAAGDLVPGAAARLAAALPLARVGSVGQDVVQVDCSGAFDEVEHVAAGVRSFFDPTAAGADRVAAHGWAIGVAIGETDVGDVTLAEAAEASLAQALAAQAAHSVGPPLVAGEDLASELDRALAEDEMELFYQPKLHVRQQEIKSAEALIRWRHPRRGLILPADFIPAAEEGRRVGPLTLWTVRRAIQDQRRLRRLGHDVRLFINISGQVLADAAFAEAVCGYIAAAPDARLGFEITETAVIRDPERAIANLQRFDSIGITVSIDDYGAGLSSLAYLKQLPARELKIDKLFITGITSSHRDPLIVRSTIDLAHALDMEVVAEGVESHAALALLSVMGCDMVQGYVLSRPVELETLAGFLSEERHHRASADTRASFTRLSATWKRA
ncbi:EAL domain-containing protein [Sphingomonas sp. BK235]|uniref:EAL domain-containing protein n=1 Tax=Sphingomonas sp. BK235 TaxID=2512131 RepID=UPI00105081C2|nr:EAL domain-containing protein [Sphingomonas sp. BK235]TCP37492.1 EAL domain-containing protein (putative c-di-GMP-specific phosphodiesterase class I) [Sphingomonas sp. BK235]